LDPKSIGNEPELYPSIQRRKLTYCAHILRSEGDTLDKDIMIDTTAGTRCTGRPGRR